MIENATETGLKRQIDGVISAAAGLLKIAANPDYASYDLRGILAESFTSLLEYKKELSVNPKLYKTVSDYLSQGDMFNSRRPAVVELMITFLAESKSVKAIRENLTAYSETVNRIDVNTANMFGFADESREDILFRLLDPEHRIDRRKESDPVSAVPEVPENSVPAPSVPTASEPSVQSVQSVQSGSPAVQERRRVSCSVPLATWDMLFVNVCVHA